MNTYPSLRACALLRCAAWLLVAASFSLFAACSDSSEAPATAPGDAATDPSTDVSSDASTEEASTGQEAGPDASPDGQDAASDTSGADQVSQDHAQDAAPAQLGVITVPELVTALGSKDFLLINVHVPYAGEIPKTDANITYLDVPAIEAFIGGDLDAKVVVYCMTNTMSGIAGNALIKDGYTNVRYLEGGLAAWQAGGNPVEFHDQ